MAERVERGGPARPSADRMTAKDRLIWRIETDTDLRPDIMILMALEGGVGQRELVAWHERAADLLPRMRATVKAPTGRQGGPPRWVADPSFDAAGHIHRVPAPGAGAWEDVLALVERLAVEPLHTCRPPWEAHLIEGLAAGGTAYLLRISHGIADGLRLREMLLRLSGLRLMLPGDSGGRPAGPATARDPVPVRWRRRLRTARDSARFLAGAARDMARLPYGPPSGPGRGARRYVTVDVPQAALRSVARGTGGSLQDALIAGVAEGCRRYNEERAAGRKRLRVLVPYGRAPAGRHDPSPVGNHWFVVGVRLLSRPMDAATRIGTVHAELTEHVRRGAVDWMGALARVTPLLPSSLVRTGFRRFAASHDVIVSNIPGPARGPITVGGTTATRVYGVAPSLGCPMSVTNFSHGGVCHLVLGIDPAVVERPGALASHVRESLLRPTEHP
ncbi:wax ester/triacylglycerol synthase domain-containing protein [Streptomyces sp. URMC 129]|uniref:wax ester/triacylglycerol synthase domain-containing protein n=1 Tax=Streptomyces sp. URMC 129 TaxID=3423407 RepID=UPI003F1AE863